MYTHNIYFNTPAEIKKPWKNRGVGWILVAKDLDANDFDYISIEIIISGKSVRKNRIKSINYMFWFFSVLCVIRNNMALFIL